ncbi:MAG: hypothetical protein P4L55_01855 [Syntrophobacteraceae bacterium]|nr:hypothetical protein [Syntrophobacteraceae bacterium]
MHTLRAPASRIVVYPSILLCLFVLISGYTEPASAMDSPASVFGKVNGARARIGILIDSAGKSVHARSLEKIKRGDKFRIYVQPGEACHIYVVHTDHKTVTLLKMFEAKNSGDLLVLPGPFQYYEVDGQSPVETFTIICSREKLNYISALFDSKVNYEDWLPVEHQLLREGNKDLGRKPAKPFPIAGNVRRFSIGHNDDPFVRGLPIYTGTTLLVKRYEFNVKK